MPENKHSASHTRHRRRRKRKNTKGTVFAVLCTLAIIGVIVFAVYKVMDKSISDMYQRGESVPTAVKTPDGVKDDVVNILVCGLDWEDSRTSMMTDVIMYVTIDAKAKKVSVLQIPRDTYVGSPSISGKINGVYWNGKKENKIMNVVDTLNTRFGLAIDHYVTLNMEAFISIVDAVEGGLRMYIPYPVVLKDKDTGREETIIAEAGWNYVSGATAEAIVRNRNYAGGDVQRLEVQSYFYAAVIKYFKDIGIGDSLKLMPRFTQHITTDMSWTRMTSLAVTALSIEFNDMTLIKPTVHGYLAGGQAVLEIPENDWIEIINQSFRPYQSPITKINIDAIPGEITTDYGQTATVIQTVGEILAKAGEDKQ